MTRPNYPRKRRGSDRWNFCANCSNWSSNFYDSSTSSPSGEFCDACLSPLERTPITDPFVVVHRAIGMTMEYLNCSGMEALVAIAVRAHETGQALPNVAGDLVERRFRFRA